MKDSSVLITGASGFLGSVLCDAFKANGHRTITPLNENNQAWRLGDEFSEAVLDSVSIVVHVAWDMRVQDPVKNNTVNVNGTLKLLNAATKKKIPFIFVSSMSSFEGAQSIYGSSKYQVEQLVLKSKGICIRPGLIWSEKKMAGISELLEKVVRTLPVVPYVSGIRHPLYLINREDLAQTIVHISERFNEYQSRTLTIANRKPYFLRDILEAMTKRSNLRRLFIPVDKSIVVAVLRTLDSLHLSPFKSDSLAGLIRANPEPDFSFEQISPVVFRDFSEWS